MAAKICDSEHHAVLQNIPVHNQGPTADRYVKLCALIIENMNQSDKLWTTLKQILPKSTN